MKRGIWHLSGRKKQKGGFLHILGALARPLLVSAAGRVGREVLKGLWGEKKKIQKKKTKDKKV